MVMIPGPLITGPEPVATRYGLFAAASGPISLPQKARGGGVRYIPVSCGVAHTYPIDCSGGVVLAPEKDGDDQNATVTTGSFAVYASIECGAIGYIAREFEDQVVRRLLNGEQGAAEYALWSGLGADGNPLGNENLVDEAVAVTNPDDSDLVATIATLENYAYQIEGYGQVAYIHAPASMASWAADRYLVETRSGDPRKYTPFGSVWVFGGGYPGTGPANAAPPEGGAYLYVTGQVTVWRSDDVWSYPVDQTMDREANQRFLLAEREYAIGFDCLAGRALFNPLGGS